MLESEHAASITFNMPQRLGYDPQDIKHGASTPKLPYHQDLIVRLDRLQYHRKFITLYDDDTNMRRTYNDTDSLWTS